MKSKLCSPLTTPTPTLLRRVLMGNTWNHSSVLALYASIVDRPWNNRRSLNQKRQERSIHAHITVGSHILTSMLTPQKHCSTCAAVKASDSVEESVENWSPECWSTVLHTANTRPAVHHRVVTVDRPHTQRAVETANCVHTPAHVHHT